MKLFDVPRETYVKVLEDVHVPVGMAPIKKGEIIFFDHIDGMYSFCMDEHKKNILHLAAFTEVEIVDL
jgi:hypothetical protein